MDGITHCCCCFSSLQPKTYQREIDRERDIYVLHKKLIGRDVFVCGGVLSGVGDPWPSKCPHHHSDTLVRFSCCC